MPIQSPYRVRKFHCGVQKNQHCKSFARCFFIAGCIFNSVNLSVTICFCRCIVRGLYSPLTIHWQTSRKAFGSSGWHVRSVWLVFFLSVNIIHLAVRGMFNTIATKVHLKEIWAYAPAQEERGINVFWACTKVRKANMRIANVFSLWSQFSFTYLSLEGWGDPN